MPLHLVKSSFGVSTVADLRMRVGEASAHGAGGPGEVLHSTKATPSRAAEILGGGSIYWIVKGYVACRQAIVDIRTHKGDDGTRCYLVLSDAVVDVEPRPRKRFLGWRYLDDAEAPPDILATDGPGLADMPEPMRRELAALGLL